MNDGVKTFRILPYLGNRLNRVFKTMGEILFWIVFGALGNAGPAGTQVSDESLKQYLKKSEAVVIGEVTDAMQRIGIDFPPGGCVSQVHFEFRVLESIQGSIRAQQTIPVLLIRVQEIGLNFPLPGEKLVLFLKPSGEGWVSVDKYLGMIPYSPAFVGDLKRVHHQVNNSKKPKRYIRSRLAARLRLCR